MLLKLGLITTMRKSRKSVNANSALRMFWFTLGLISLACGIVGIILPLLPTTPFLLFCAYAFARSSPRLHRWLIRHPYFGSLIENWKLYGAIDRSTKRIALTIMMFTPLVSWFIGAPFWLLVVQVIVLTTAAVFIATRPQPRSTQKGGFNP